MSVIDSDRLLTYLLLHGVDGAGWNPSSLGPSEAAAFLKFLEAEIPDPSCYEIVRRVRDRLRAVRYLALLPMLEHPFLDVSSDIAGHLAALPASELFTPAEVSLCELVLFALRGDSEYWRSRAVEWLEHGAPVDEEITRELKRLESLQGLPQRDRHRIRRILRTRCAG